MLTPISSVSSEDLPNSREDWSEIDDAAMEVDGWILRDTKQDVNLGRDRVIIMVESFIFQPMVLPGRCRWLS